MAVGGWFKWKRERGISEEDVKWMQFSPWKGLIESPGWYQCDREVTTGLGGLCCPEKDRCPNYSLGGEFLRALREWISGFHDRLRTRHWIPI
jgi:hypothetical protein